MLLQSIDNSQNLNNKLRKKSLIDYLKSLTAANKSTFYNSVNRSNHSVRSKYPATNSDYEDGNHQIYNATIYSTDSVDISDFINEIFGNYIPKEYAPYVISGIGLLILFLILICCCFQRNKLKTSNLSSSKIKMKATNLKSKQPVTTSALATKTVSQNDETLSLSNIPIETDLNLITQAKENKVDKKDKKQKKSKPLISAISAIKSKDLAESQIEASVISKFSTKPISSIQSQIHDSILAGSEIDQRATLRIKKFSKSGKSRLKSRRSRRSSEIKHKLHRTKKKSKTVVKSVNDSFATFTDRSTDTLKDKSIEPSKDQTKEPSTDSRTKDSKSSNTKESNTKDSTDKTKTEEPIQIPKKVKRRSKSSKRRKKKKLKSLYFKSLSRKFPKVRKNRSKEPEVFKLNTIKIYNKTISFKNKSDELVSILKQIPSLDSSKLPSPKELYSPPSSGTLKKGKPITIDLNSSSNSSSEELLINNLKKFKARSKDKLKTKSTEPLLDGEFH